MSAIRATWKDGRIIPDGPVNWPEGSRLLVEPDPAGSLEVSDDAWSNTPEAIAEWLKWCDSVQPLVVSPEEEADAEAWLRNSDHAARGQYQLSRSRQRSAHAAGTR